MITIDENATQIPNFRRKTLKATEKIPLKSEIESIESQKFAQILELDNISPLDVQ